MSRLTLAAYDKLCQDISTWIENTGYVPPVRVLADLFKCSPVTAWRIVRSQGWIAKGHHWEEVQQGKRNELQVETRHAWYYQTYRGVNVEQISSRRDAAGEI